MTDLLASWTVHDDLVGMQVSLEGSKVSIVDAQHAAIQLELKHTLQLSNCVHLHKTGTQRLQQLRAMHSG